MCAKVLDPVVIQFADFAHLPQTAKGIFAFKTSAAVVPKESSRISILRQEVDRNVASPEAVDSSHSLKEKLIHPSHFA